MSLAQIKENFIWRIQTLTPTHTRPGKKFIHVDPRREDADVSSGTTRNFTVYWQGSGTDVEPTDITERVAEHQFMIEVAYSTDYKIDLLQDIICSDRNDLNKLLRNTDYFLGYSDTYAANAIGLWSRVRISDEIVRNNEITWYLRQLWRCTIQEVE